MAGGGTRAASSSRTSWSLGIGGQTAVAIRTRTQQRAADAGSRGLAAWEGVGRSWRGLVQVRAGDVACLGCDRRRGRIAPTGDLQQACRRGHRHDSCAGFRHAAPGACHLLPLQLRACVRPARRLRTAAARWRATRSVFTKVAQLTAAADRSGAGPPATACKSALLRPEPSPGCAGPPRGFLASVRKRWCRHVRSWPLLAWPIRH